MTGADDWTSGMPALLLHTCADCSARWYVPRSRCPACGSPGVRALEPAGTGTTVAVTCLPGEGGEIRLALVDLDEEVRVLGRTVADVMPGDRVALSFPTTPPQPWFEPVTGEEL